jgi:hypothetical protein
MEASSKPHDFQLMLQQVSGPGASTYATYAG